MEHRRKSGRCKKNRLPICQGINELSEGRRLPVDMGSPKEWLTGATTISVWQCWFVLCRYLCVSAPKCVLILRETAAAVLPRMVCTTRPQNCKSTSFFFGRGGGAFAQLEQKDSICGRREEGDPISPPPKKKEKKPSRRPNNSLLP